MAERGLRYTVDLDGSCRLGGCLLKLIDFKFIILLIDFKFIG